MRQLTLNPNLRPNAKSKPQHMNGWSGRSGSPMCTHLSVLQQVCICTSGFNTNANNPKTMIYVSVNLLYMYSQNNMVLGLLNILQRTKSITLLHHTKSIREKPDTLIAMKGMHMWVQGDYGFKAGKTLGELLTNLLCTGWLTYTSTQWSRNALLCTFLQLMTGWYSTIIV